MRVAFIAFNEVLTFEVYQPRQQLFWKFGVSLAVSKIQDIVNDTHTEHLEQIKLEVLHTVFYTCRSFQSEF